MYASSIYLAYLVIMTRVTCLRHQSLGPDSVIILFITSTDKASNKLHIHASPLPASAAAQSASLYTCTSSNKDGQLLLLFRYIAIQKMMEAL